MAGKIGVRVLYFGPAREAAGGGEELVQLPTQASLRDLVREVTRSHDGLARLREGMRFSVNQELASGDVRLKEGDEVAFLPPVAGG